MYYIVSEKNRWKKGELRETREREGEKGARERGRGKKVVVVQPRFRSVLLRKGISTAENRREKRQKKKKKYHEYDFSTVLPAKDSSYNGMSSCIRQQKTKRKMK